VRNPVSSKLFKIQREFSGRAKPRHGAARKTIYAAKGHAPVGGTNSAGSRILTTVPAPSAPDIVSVPPS
jgi:hypothetical protein